MNENKNTKKSDFYGHRYNIGVSTELKEAFAALCDREGRLFPIREDMSVSTRGVNLFGGRYINAVVKFMISEAVRVGKLPFDTTNLYTMGGFRDGKLDANIAIRIDVDHKDEFTRICKAERVPIARAIRFYVAQCVENDKILVRPQQQTEK